VLVIAISDRNPRSAVWADVQQAVRALVDDAPGLPHARILLVTDGGVPKLVAAAARERRLPLAVIGPVDTTADLLPPSWVNCERFEVRQIRDALAWLQIDPARARAIAATLPDLAESAGAWQTAHAVLAPLRALVDAASPQGRVAIERARVAEQLDRELGPRLAELRGSLERFGQRAVGADLDLASLSDRIAQASEELDGIVWAMEEKARRWDAITSYVAHRVDELGGTRCRCRAEGPAAELVDGTTSLHLLRIVQEAVRNALVHTQAQRIDVMLGCEGAKLTIRVEDDGGGMPPETRDTMYGGLHNIRARALASGGSAELTSDEGGTSWLVELSRGGGSC
jgi:signal transduction histidine kinase